jgi:hypothetical protein
MNGGTTNTADGTYTSGTVSEKSAETIEIIGGVTYPDYGEGAAKETDVINTTSGFSLELAGNWGAGTTLPTPIGSGVGAFTFGEANTSDEITFSTDTALQVDVSETGLGTPVSDTAGTVTIDAGLTDLTTNTALIGSPVTLNPGDSYKFYYDESAKWYMTPAQTAAYDLKLSAVSAPPVPEPAALSLLALGTIRLLARRRRI